MIKVLSPLSVLWRTADPTQVVHYGHGSWAYVRLHVGAATGEKSRAQEEIQYRSAYINRFRMTFRALYANTTRYGDSRATNDFGSGSLCLSIIFGRPIRSH